MSRERAIPWRRIASAVADRLPRASLHRDVLAWVDAAPRRTWHVALSGGADSVVLLLLLWAHWPERRVRLCALHFDHRLRGAASRADAAFCRRLCRSLGVKLKVGEWRRPAADGRRARPSEAAARAARMTFFRQHASVLWLAHHADDVAETMLMRLARGSGAAGLSAPRPVQTMPGAMVHLRPLLAVRKANLIAALAGAGGKWREDETNAGPAYFRNRVRHQVVPAWIAAAERDAVAGAALSRELLAEDEVALEAWADSLRPLAANGDLLLRRLAGKPRALWRRALQRWLRHSGRTVEISRQAFEALLDAAMRGMPTRHSLGSEAFARLRRGRLSFQVGKTPTKILRRVN